MKQTLDLAPVGNCSVSALINRCGRYVWACAPRVDGDPVFSALMDGDDPEHGFWEVCLADLKEVEQAYIKNTPVLRTVLTAACDCAPPPIGARVAPRPPPAPIISAITVPT